ncbi:QcrA and Rieske domain-containing protein [Spirosoma validum]|uniref:Rieske (2Fe-2S) protein n=1 Tax=Spirosoma validum TaxID=2771355 RepID=A0A927GE30_9BACT|nr:Rieske (2Fe-2S) protein [Spirosoma validum]MBD2754344.1 Rieske (2Fe-2S) protein [Spirosoma validum]
MKTETISRHDFFRLVGTSVGVILLSNSSMGCSNQSGGDPEPVDQNIDFTLRLSDQINENLRIKGGYIVANNIIIAQTKDGQFIAVSATCTCATQGTLLAYKPADNQFYCPQHLSRYDSAGKVIVGPATQPLVKYQTGTGKSADTLRIYL